MLSQNYCMLDGADVTNVDDRIHSRISCLLASRFFACPLERGGGGGIVIRLRYLENV